HFVIELWQQGVFEGHRESISRGWPTEGTEGTDLKTGQRRERSYRKGFWTRPSDLHKTMQVVRCGALVDRCWSDIRKTPDGHCSERPSRAVGACSIDQRTRSATNVVNGAISMSMLARSSADRYVL